MDVANLNLSILSHAADDPGVEWGQDAAFAAVEAFDRVVRAEYVLDTDATVTVSLASLGLASASLVFVSARGGRARVRLTSANGTLQALPDADPVAFVLSRHMPITALDLTRPAGSPTVRVRVALGAPPP